MSTRSAEYRSVIDELLAEDAALRAQGLPGLEEDEWIQLKDLVANAISRLGRQMNETVLTPPEAAT